MFGRIHLLAAQVVFVGVISSAATCELFAQPHVNFDLPSTVEARIVESEEFSAGYGERVVNVQLPISTFLQQGGERDLVELSYQLESRTQTELFVDYSPKTERASRYVGEINVERKNETNKSLGANVSGKIAGHQIGPISGGGNWANKDQNNISYKLATPQTTIASSGTIRRGYGVYFKQRPSNRESFEGEKTFSVTLRVKEDWRGGLLYVSCAATGVRRSVVSALNEAQLCGQQRFVVAVYLTGDEEAKQIADDFAAAEHSLREIARKEIKGIERRRYPTVMHQIGAVLDVVEAKVPENWLDPIVFGLPAGASVSYEAALPVSVRKAVRNYRLRLRILADLATSAQHSAKTISSAIMHAVDSESDS